MFGANHEKVVTQNLSYRMQRTGINPTQFHSVLVTPTLIEKSMGVIFVLSDYCQCCPRYYVENNHGDLV
jgi:hypothetical protein